MDRDLLIAEMIHDIINKKIMNIIIEADAEYMTKNTFEQTIDDVHLYLNFLTPEYILDFVKEKPQKIDAEEILNIIVSDFNTKHLTVSCKVPNKHNFRLDSITEDTLVKPEESGVFVEAFIAMLLICVGILIVNILIK